VVTLVLGVLVATTGGAPSGAADPPAAAPPAEPNGPVGPLDHAGRWLTDPDGRIVQLHGTNFVAKWPADDPMTPAEAGFGAEDAAFLAEQGFNVVRLGVVFGAVMPAPGVIDTAYVDAIAETVDQLAAEEIFVLLDVHQDGYGPLVHGNGFPAWATLTDGLPNPNVGFPAYYVQNPALQRAFDNFWENEAGPDGVPLQQHYATALQAVAAEVADEPYVLGYDTMNEPWPGTEWAACLTGCPDLEQSRLAPFAQRMTDAIRAVDPDGFVFTEPFVLFNFGRTGTSLHGFGAPRSGLSFHVYALTPEEDEAVIEHAIAASANGDAILATEFGATNDGATIDRLTGAFDERHVPWIFWTYDEHLVVHMDAPPTPDNVRQPVLTALARPYASATNGSPTSYAYDPATRTLEYAYTTTQVDGAAAPLGLTTVLAMPPAAYPDGYTVEVTGATVASAPGARELELCHESGATEVVVRIVPGADPTPAPPSCELPPEPPMPTSTTGGAGPTSAPSPGDPAPVGPLPAVRPTTVASPVAGAPRFTG
jgi:endoglycosylceramidase